MDRTTPWLTLALASLLLAGCSGGSGTDEAAREPEDAAVAARAMQPLRHSLAAPVEQVHWANGTFAAQEACNPVGCLLGEETWQRRTDLTPALPATAPVQLELELTYAPHPLMGFVMQVLLEAPESVVYAKSVLEEPGRSTIVATLLPRGSVQAVVRDFHATGEGPESTYALRVRVVASPDVVPPGVPVAVQLAGGDTLRVGADGEARDFLLFGPGGVRLGAFPGEAVLDAAARAGEYAVLLPPGSAAPLASDNGDVSLRPLGLRHEASPPATVAQAGAMEETWDIQGLPVGVGLRFFTQPVAAGMAPFITSDLSAQLIGPDGVVLDTGAINGYVTFGELSEELRWTTPLGDERVTAGTHTIHAESMVTYEAHVEAFAIYIDMA